MNTSGKSPPQRLLRLAHPLAFAAFLRHIGAPAERHLRRVGLPALCQDPNVFVCLKQAWAFFDSTTRHEDRLLGWQVGRFIGDQNLNAGLLEKIEHAPSLYAGLQQCVRLVGLEASHLRLGIHERSSDILFYTHYPNLQSATGYDASQAYQLEVYLSLVRHYAGPQWLPHEIGIEARDVPAGLQDHLPGTRILPGQHFGYVAVPRSCLHLAARDDTRDIRSEENSDEDSFIFADKFNYAETLRALLQPYLGDGYPSAKFAATLMDTSPRTVARRLQERGLSYAGLLDDLRFTTAKKLLQDDDMKIADVAGSIGFDDPSHFARMFRRIGGLSPRQFRRSN